MFKLVKVKCTECGKEYELDEGENLSDYMCVECGGNLDYKNYSARNSDSSKKPGSSKTSDGSKKPVKDIIFISVIALLVIVVLLTVFTNVHPNAENQTNITNNSTPHIANETYAANGITFNYPAGWKQMYNLDAPSRWGYTNPEVAFYDPEGNKSENDELNTYFYIKQRHVSSLDEMISTYRIDIAEIGQTYVSHRNITVNGMRAVELIKTWNNGGKQFRALTVHIEVIPGSLYYRIGCVTPQDQYNETLPKFEMVVYSFNIIK